MSGPRLAKDETAGWWRLSWGRAGRTKVVQVSSAADLERHVLALRARGHVLRERVALHTCSVCQRQAPWGPTWTWYGSVADMDVGILVPKLCSDDCRSRARDAKIVPRNARIMDGGADA